MLRRHQTKIRMRSGVIIAGPQQIHRCLLHELIPAGECRIGNAL